jgi:hypothetical protein
MSCFSKPSLDELHPVKHQLRPSVQTFTKGSLLARLDQGEPLESIKANMTYMSTAPKKKRRKLKNWLGFSRNAVELPAEDIPRKVELPGDVSAQKKFTELDSKARIELPINPSKEAQLQEESAGWATLMMSRREKAKIAEEKKARELAKRVELDAPHKSSAAELPGNTYRPFLVELDGADTTTGPNENGEPLHNKVAEQGSPLTTQLSESAGGQSSVSHVPNSAKLEQVTGVPREIKVEESLERINLPQYPVNHNKSPDQMFVDKEQELRWLENVEAQIQARKTQLMAGVVEP